MRKKRTLYECFHARVNNGRIRCAKGYLLSVKSDDGGIDTKRLALGKQLAFSVCQGCTEFDSMGPPLRPEERGWLNGRGNTGAFLGVNDGRRTNQITANAAPNPPGNR